MCDFTHSQARSKLDGAPVSKGVGNLLYHTATRFKGSKVRASMLLDYITSEKLVTEQQLSGKGWSG